jgi:hypothetical protein
MSNEKKTVCFQLPQKPNLKDKNRATLRKSYDIVELGLSPSFMSSLPVQLRTELLSSSFNGQELITTFSVESQKVFVILPQRLTMRNGE